jgi:hypothetical protein
MESLEVMAPLECLIMNPRSMFSSWDIGRLV